MARGLEHVLWKKRLRDRGLFSPEKMALEETLLQPAPIYGEVNEKMEPAPRDEDCKLEWNFLRKYQDKKMSMRKIVC